MGLCGKLYGKFECLDSYLWNFNVYLSVYGLLYWMPYGKFECVWNGKCIMNDIVMEVLNGLWN